MLPVGSLAHGHGLLVVGEVDVGPGSDFCLRSQTTISPGLLAADGCRAPELPSNFHPEDAAAASTEFTRLAQS